MIKQLINKILKRQSSQLIQNRQFLLKRQSQQLSLLQPLKNKVNHQLLDKTIKQLLKINQQEVFNTFVCRNLNPKIKELNGLADVNIQRALKKNHKGIPFTVKDHLKVDGMIQTCGYSKNITPSTQCSQVVQLLQKQGCIAYAHTNVPQGLLGIQSSNRVWGPCKNPYDAKFIAGGSSGGEGPQVATKASVFGVCSDSAGSVRIPAAFCGVYGFKPTGSKRLSVKGRVGVTGKQGPSLPGLDTSFGFITRNVQDLQWLCQKTLGKSMNYNPQIFGKWNNQLFEQSKKQKRRFGVISKTDEIQLAPAVQNVLNQTIQLLKKQGHEVVQFDFTGLTKIRNFFFKLLNNVHFYNVMRLSVQGQHTMPQLQQAMNYFNSTYLGRKLKVHFAQSQMQKQRYRMHDIGQTTIQLIGLLKQRDLLEQQYNKKWKQSKIDLLLSPTMPFTAPFHHQTEHLIHQLTFTAFQNVFQLPAGHVPVRLVRADEVQYNDTRFYGSQIRRSIHKSQGLPVGVQFTGQFMKDQIVLGAMWQIQKAMGKKIILPNFD